MKKVLLFSHDPGGSNAIVPLVRAFRKRGYSVKLFGKGISLKRYAQFGVRGLDIMKRIKRVGLGEIKKFLKDEKPDFIITGTSANDSTEKYIWNVSRDLKIPSFAVLDQWANYGIRFSHHGVSQIEKYNHNKTHHFSPTKIFVMDLYAKKQLDAIGISDTEIVVTGHPYFEMLLQDGRKIIKDHTKSFRRNNNIKNSDIVITFASEPIVSAYGVKNGSIGCFGYTEVTILRDILSVLKKIVEKHKLNVVLVIKLHPREEDNSFNQIIEENKTDGLSVRLIRNCNVWELMAESDVICGMTSMFLIEAVLLGKPILSVQIGAVCKSEFILEREGVVDPVLSKGDLANRLEGLIIKPKLPRRSFRIVKNASKNIIDHLEYHYANIGNKRREKSQD